jgi:hypothetical protein
VAPYRPLPAYDGSVGPIPLNDVDTNFLLARYGITKPTLFKRRDALVEGGWVKPTRLANRVYYSGKDVHLLDSVHYWATRAYNLTEIIHHLKQQEGGGAEQDENAFEPLLQVDVEAVNTTNDLVVSGLKTSARELQVLGDEFVEKFAKRVGEVISQTVPRDALAAHDFLSKAADKKYQLTGKILAEGMGVKNATVSGWSDREEKLGFVIIRVGKGQWKVERLEEELAA